MGAGRGRTRRARSAAPVSGRGPAKDASRAEVEWHDNEPYVNDEKISLKEALEIQAAVRVRSGTPDVIAGQMTFDEAVVGDEPKVEAVSSPGGDVLSRTVGFPKRNEVEKALRALLRRRGENNIWVGQTSASSDYKAARERGLMDDDTFKRAQQNYGRRWNYSGD